MFTKGEIVKHKTGNIKMVVKEIIKESFFNKNKKIICSFEFEHGMYEREFYGHELVKVEEEHKNV